MKRHSNYYYIFEELAINAASIRATRDQTARTVVVLVVADLGRRAAANAKHVARDNAARAVDRLVEVVAIAVALNATVLVLVELVGRKTTVAVAVVAVACLDENAGVH